VKAELLTWERRDDLAVLGLPVGDGRVTTHLEIAQLKATLRKRIPAMTLALAAIFVAACGRRGHMVSPDKLVARGDIDGVRAFLAEDPKNIRWTNSAGKTLLNLAVVFNQEPILDLLLSQGAPQGKGS
jgi:hypothetical protein